MLKGLVPGSNRGTLSFSRAKRKAAMLPKIDVNGGRGLPQGRRMPEGVGPAPVPESLPRLRLLKQVQGGVSPVPVQGADELWGANLPGGVPYNQESIEPHRGRGLLRPGPMEKGRSQWARSLSPLSRQPGAKEDTPFTYVPDQAAALLQQNARERVREHQRQRRRKMKEEETRRALEEQERLERLQRSQAQVEAHRRELAKRSAEIAHYEKERKGEEEHRKEEELSARREKVKRYMTPDAVRETKRHEHIRRGSEVDSSQSMSSLGASDRRQRAHRPPSAEMSHVTQVPSPRGRRQLTVSKDVSLHTPHVALDESKVATSPARRAVDAQKRPAPAADLSTRAAELDKVPFSVVPTAPAAPRKAPAPDFVRARAGLIPDPTAAPPEESRVSDYVPSEADSVPRAPSKTPDQELAEMLLCPATPDPAAVPAADVAAEMPISHSAASEGEASELRDPATAAAPEAVEPSAATPGAAPELPSGAPIADASAPETVPAAEPKDQAADAASSAHHGVELEAEVEGAPRESEHKASEVPQPTEPLSTPSAEPAPDPPKPEPVASTDTNVAPVPEPVEQQTKPPTDPQVAAAEPPPAEAAPAAEPHPAPQAPATEEAAAAAPVAESSPPAPAAQADAAAVPATAGEPGAAAALAEVKDPALPEDGDAGPAPSGAKDDVPLLEALAAAAGSVKQVPAS